MVNKRMQKDRMNKRKVWSVLPAVLMLLFISTPRSSAQGVHDQPAPTATSENTETGLPGKSGSSSSAHLPPLEDLHDAGYVLQLIKQQAVDIYAEARRLKTVTPGTVEPLVAIPNQPVRAESAYKPLRKAWVVFFIGTMEPLVKLLDEAFKDVSTGAVELKVPPNKKALLDRMLVQITDSIASINTHLNKCAEVLDTSDSGNKVIAQEAASIVSEVSKAERVRAKTVLLFGNLGEPGTYEMRETNNPK
jgi:hypothetical protein